MKFFFAFLFLTFSSSFSAHNYECSMSGIQFFPEQKEISLHPMIIIEGYAYSQQHIETLKDREVYLESAAGEKIVLELQKVLKGQMQLTQAIFKPVRSLSPNSRYYLKLSAATNDRELAEFSDRYNPEKKEREPVYWETSTLQHSAPLNKNLTINFTGTNVEFYGCGPAATAVFNVSEKGDAPVWYKTEVVELSTGRNTTYYIKEWQDRLNVGHGMCSGAFTFRKEGSYKVRFTPMNLDGQELKTTSWITFESPFLNAENPWGF